MGEEIEENYPFAFNLQQLLNNQEYEQTTLSCFDFFFDIPNNTWKLWKEIDFDYYNFIGGDCASNNLDYR
jgi:hypothetical protein